MSIRPFLVLLHVGIGDAPVAPMLHSVLAASADEAVGNAVTGIFRSGQRATITGATPVDVEDATRKLFEQREMQQANASRAMRDAEAEAMRVGVHPPPAPAMVRVPEGHATIDPADPLTRC